MSEFAPCLDQINDFGRVCMLQVDQGSEGWGQDTLWWRHLEITVEVSPAYTGEVNLPNGEDKLHGEG